MKADPHRSYQSAVVYLILLAVVLIPFFHVGLEFSATKTALASLLALPGLILFALSRSARPPAGIPFTPAFIPLAAFLILFGLSAFTAASRFVAGAEIISLFPLLAFLFLTFLSFREPDLDRLSLVLAVPVAGVSLIGILQYFEVLPIGMDRYGAKDAASTLGLSNFAAEYLAAALFPLAGAALGRGRTLFRLILGLAVGLGVIYLLLTGSRAGWVGFLAGGAGAIIFSILHLRGQFPRRAFLFLISPRNLLVAGFSIVIAFAFLFFTPGGKQIQRRFASILNTRDSAVSFRLLAAREALRMTRDHPFLGVGPGNFSIVEPRYQTPEMERLYRGMNVDISRVHNEYFGLLAETGIPAALCFFAFLGFLLASLYRSLQRARSSPELLVRLGTAGGIIASLAIALFSFNLHNPSSGLIFWILAGAALKTAAPAREIRASLPGREKSLRLIFSVLGLAVILIFTWICFQNIKIACAEINFRKGLRWMAKERADQAEIFLSRAISIHPHRAGYYYNRAMCRHHQEKADLALPDLERYLEFHPYSSRGHQALGAVLIELGKEPEAAGEIQRALELSPRPAPALFSLFLNLKLGQKDYDSVIRTGIRARELYPRNFQIILALAQAYFYRRDFDRARILYERALEIKPENDLLYRYLAQVHVELGNFVRAEEILLPAVSRSPDSPDLWLHLARAQAGAGKIESARDSLRNALSLDPRVRTLVEKDRFLKLIGK